jgi:polar amino acid transport system substrate-binding protein
MSLISTRCGRGSLLSVLVVTAFAATGCTTASPSEGGPVTKASQAPAVVNAAAAALVPASVKSAGTITFASDASYAPFEFFDTDNKTLIGLDIELTDALARVLGVKAEHINAGFDTILPGLQSGKYDAGVSAFGVTEERRKVVDFVPYTSMGSGLGVAPGNPDKLTLTDPKSLCGKTVTAQKGSIQGIDALPKFSRECQAAGAAAVTIRLYPSQNEANLALSSGRAQAVMADSVPLAYEAKQSNGQFVLAQGQDYSPVPLAIAVPNGSKLGPALSAAMGVLLKNGTLAELLKRWSVPAGDLVASTDLVP